MGLFAFWHVRRSAIAEEIGREVDYRPVTADGAAREAATIAEVLQPTPQRCVNRSVDALAWASVVPPGAASPSRVPFVVSVEQEWNAVGPTLGQFFTAASCAEAR
jgi:hypothetical protein